MEEKKQFNPADMDTAASEAEQDLANLTDEAVKSVADWWNKWYLKAGHKRLGRILVQIAKS